MLCATSIPDTSHRGFSGPPLQDHRKWFSLMGAVCLKKNSFVSQLALEISFIPGVRSITPYFVVLLRLSRLIITDIRTLYRVYKGTKNTIQCLLGVPRMVPAGVPHGSLAC